MEAEKEKEDVPVNKEEKEDEQNER